MDGLKELYNNFNSNFQALDQSRRAELLLYTQAIKLAKFEEFKKRERAAFEMVKNLFTFPGRFNKEQLELFSASFIQNTQACMSALEKGGSDLQLRDMENKLFASLLWALSFGCVVDVELKSDVQALWHELLKTAPKLKEAYSNVIDGLSLDDVKKEIMRKASLLSVEEILPVFD